MAKSKVKVNARKLYVDVPTDTKSGDPVVIGDIPGVALIDEQDDGKATVDTGGSYELEVYADPGDDTGQEVSVGDILYYDESNDEINVDDSGVRFGYALEAIAAGETQAIEVKLGY